MHCQARTPVQRMRTQVNAVPSDAGAVVSCQWGRNARGSPVTW
jgi:hypothetical protein